MNISDIKNMSTAKRLQIMEEIWDTFTYEEIESPKWHEKVLKSRKAKIAGGKAKFLSLKELKAGRKQ